MDFQYNCMVHLEHNDQQSITGLLFTEALVAIVEKRDHWSSVYRVFDLSTSPQYISNTHMIGAKKCIVLHR